MSQHGRRPDIFLIVLDCLRADRVQLCDGRRQIMPHLDRFCQTATVFERAFSVAPWTVPSHASIFTGHYPPAHRVQHGHLTLDCEARTLAEVLSDAGYHTIGICANPHVSASRLFDRGFAEYHEMWRGKGPAHRVVDKARHVAQRAKLSLDSRLEATSLPVRLSDRRAWHCDHGTRARLINRRLARSLQQAPDTPRFVFLNYLEAHLPYAMVPPFYRISMPDAHLVRRALRLNQDPRLHTATGAGMGPEEFELLGRRYDAAVHYLDFRLGEALQIIQAVGDLDRSLVIVTSDHGENLGDHGLMDHQYCVYDSLLRVPLAVKWPGEARTERVSTPVESVDLYGCVLSVAELSNQSPLGPGARAADRARPTYAAYASPLPDMLPWLDRYPSFDVSAYDHDLLSIRCEEMKLIVSSRGGRELYDTVADPGETTDLSARMPELTERLHQSLNRWRSELPVVGRAQHEPQADFDSDDTLRHLRGLGYA
ncbi:MAG: sulfatase-like hydrolase/transferase [Armatimonadota bacterium]